MSKVVTISLTADQALVLFEWLAQRWDALPKTNDPLDANEIVLAHIQGTLEKTLAEPFAANYDSLVQAARQRILSGS